MVKMCDDQNDGDANQGENSVMTVDELQASWWRILAGITGFVQMTLFLSMSFLLMLAASTAFFCVFAGSHNKPPIPKNTSQCTAAEQNEFQEDISYTSGVNFADVQKNAGYGIVISFVLLNAVFAFVQTWRGYQLVVASWKWQEPYLALALLTIWRRSAVTYRCYLCGFLLCILLFGTECAGTSFLVLVASLLMAVLLIFAGVIGYWMEVNDVVRANNDDENGNNGSA